MAGHKHSASVRLSADLHRLIPKATDVISASYHNEAHKQARTDMSGRNVQCAARQAVQSGPLLSDDKMQSHLNEAFSSMGEACASRALPGEVINSTVSNTRQTVEPVQENNRV